MKVSLVVPCYNEQDNVCEFHHEATGVFKNSDYQYEFIFVNDGSKDQTLVRLKELYAKDPTHVNVVSFSRNFGKESAMYAGMKNASGDYVTIIDADLQQRPELVLNMLNFLEENKEYDCVAAYQEERRENFIVRGCKNLFYKLINLVSEVDFRPGASDFRTMRRQVVDAILSLPEYHRFSKGIFSWVGFETYYMPYVADERYAGSSKWSFSKLMKYAIDGILAYSVSPLKVATYIGLILSGASIIYMIVVIIQKIFFSIAIPGYATLVCLILLLGGLQLFILGIIGEYLSKMYIEGKNRPIYIEKLHLKAKEPSKDGECENEEDL